MRASVTVRLSEPFQPDVPRSLFRVNTPPETVPFLNQYVATADGQRFLVNGAVGESAMSFTVVTHWLPGTTR